MDRQARTVDTLLVKRVEKCKVGDPNTAAVAGGGGVKTTENKIRWPSWLEATFIILATQLCVRDNIRRKKPYIMYI